MSRGYQRADALERLIFQRREKKRQSEADKCQQIIDSWLTKGLTKEVLELIQDLPINQALTEAYLKDK